MAYLFYYKEEVPDVQGDVAADLGVEDEVAHGSFPYAVEVDADEVAVGIQDRAAGVAAGGVVGGQEAYGLALEAAIPSWFIGSRCQLSFCAKNKPGRK